MTRTVLLLFLLSCACFIATGPAKADYIPVTYSVDPVAQQKSMDCWVAAAAMLISWKKAEPVSEDDGAAAAGGAYQVLYLTDAGLRGEDISGLAQKLGLRVEGPQSFGPDGYYKLLKDRGPLWIGTAIFGANRTYKHVRVVRGISGDGTGDGTILSILDPDGGRDYTETVTQFAAELEEIANLDFHDPSLQPQVIHY